MSTVNLFHLRDGVSFGSVLTVDTGSVVVQVFDPETLRRLHVHRPVLLKGRPGRSLIGNITRITRKIQAAEDDGTEAVPEIVSIDSVEVGLIGTLHNMGGKRPPRFRRAIETIPEIDALCFSLEGDRLSTFMRAVSEVSEKDGHPLLLGRYALDTSADAFLNGDRLFQRHAAKGCGQQFSMTSGTIFASRKLTIRDYLLAIVIFINAAKGISSLQLARDLGVQYKTAFVLTHKLREAMAAQLKGMVLNGTVEVDGCYVGGHVRPANRKEDRVDRRLAEKT